MKHFGLGVLLFMVFSAVSFAEKKTHRLADGDDKPETGSKKRALSDNEIKESTLAAIKEIFPAVASRDNKKYFQEKTFDGQKLSDAINRVTATPDSLQSEHAIGEAIGGLMNTLDKESFATSWKKLQEKLTAYAKPGKELTQEEALLKRVEVAFENWGTASTKETSKDLKNFLKAWSQEGKDSEKTKAEEFKKEQMNLIKKAGDSSLSESQRKEARDKLLGEPTKGINDPANKFAVGKDALKHPPKDLEVSLVKALSQKVGDSWGIVMANPQGKAIFVKLPDNDQGIQNAFKHAKIQNWSVAGNPTPTTFASELVWSKADKDWVPVTQALPTGPGGVTQNQNGPKPSNSPAAGGGVKPTPAGGGSTNSSGSSSGGGSSPKSGSERSTDDRAGAPKESTGGSSSSGDEAKVSPLVSAKCNTCHQSKDVPTISFNGSKLVESSGNVVSLAELDRMRARAKLSPDEYALLKKFVN